MRKVKKAITIISFALALPFAGLTYFLVDRCRRKKKQSEVDYKPTFHSRFPEGYHKNPTESDFVKEFNDWSEHIYKELNHLKN